MKRPKQRSSAADRPAPDQSTTEQTHHEETAADDNGQENNEDMDKVYPGISIWGAFSVPACLLSRKEHELLSILQTCGFSVLECKVSRFF